MLVLSIICSRLFFSLQWQIVGRKLLVVSVFSCGWCQCISVLVVIICLECSDFLGWNYVVRLLLVIVWCSCDVFGLGIVVVVSEGVLLVVGCVCVSVLNRVFMLVVVIGLGSRLIIFSFSDLVISCVEVIICRGVVLIMVRCGGCGCVVSVWMNWMLFCLGISRLLIIRLQGWQVYSVMVVFMFLQVLIWILVWLLNRFVRKLCWKGWFFRIRMCWVMWGFFGVGW